MRSAFLFCCTIILGIVINPLFSQTEDIYFSDDPYPAQDHPEAWETPSIPANYFLYHALVRPSGYWSADGVWRTYGKLTHYPLGRLIRHQGKEGFIDHQGQFFLPVIYQWVRPILEAEKSFLAPLYKEGKQFFIANKGFGQTGVIDEQNRVVIPFAYSAIYPHGMALKGKTWSRIDHQNRLTSDPYGVEKRHRITYIDGKRGLEDLEGNILLSHQYLSLHLYGDCGLYELVDTFLNKMLFDTNLDTVLFASGRRTFQSSHFGLRYFRTTAKGKQGIYEPLQKRWIVPPQYEYISMEFQHLSRFILSNEDRFGVVDHYGNFTIPLGKYDSYSRDEHPLLILSLEGQKALIDLDGNLLIDFGIYDDIYWKNGNIQLIQGVLIGFYHPVERVELSPQIERFTQNPQGTDTFHTVIAGENRTIRFVDGQYLVE